ncbi:probable cationic amino acid transporter [Silurus meridionalis]|uniref:probable cationic amino acid transporter n=1 Tax=Silurus meridionalis TaxID=175797 RepID=UPI001EEAD95E|nr:probable cationic amino acid transporter [Silurus meridionalis]XP_046689363.1 probable cationic amino acid transporter [Silurus meridionalis]XP_046689364.1 probable cationic amino acid transporter [Silurus meridionalis]
MMSSVFAKLNPRRIEWAASWYGLHSRVMRTKPLHSMQEGFGDLHGTSRLAQVLTTVDLVSLGVGSCVGTGMYVVAGLVAKEMAGPGVILSFIIAAVASILSGVCYAEFGVRVPKTTGSAYTYSYVTVGEFVAFFIGWNLILEYLIGTAAGASALSSMFDSLANHSISRYMITHLGTMSGLGKGEESYPDLLALFIAAIVTVIVALGVKNSVSFNNVLNIVNLVVWVFVVIAGLFFLSGKNWEDGRFLPYGWSGVMQGAATCFYAFIGFDIIATTGEEAKSPNTSIPYAITASLVTCLIAYVSVSVILTLMVPYNLIDGDAPLMEMFAVHGFMAGKYIVAVGAIAGLTVSLLGSLFPMPRVIYAMAGDGLLFRFLSHVSPHTETPVVACAMSGFLAAFLALLVSLRDLIEMMSIGTLLAYTLVSVCVLLLRYQPEADGFTDGLPDEFQKSKVGVLAERERDLYSPSDGDEYGNTCGAKNIPSQSDDEMLISKSDSGGYQSESSGYSEGEKETEFEESDSAVTAMLKRTLGSNYYALRMRLRIPEPGSQPTPATGRTVTYCVLVFFVLTFVLWLVVIYGLDRASAGAHWVLVPFIITVIIFMAGLIVLILQQPQSTKRLPYMAPFVPFVPTAAILVNIYLMLKLSCITWVRFVVWCFIGVMIYFGYGMWNSSLELSAREEEAHASSYQRYDAGVDESFTSNDGLHTEECGEDGRYQGWAAEERSYQYQNQHQNQHQEQYQDQYQNQHQDHHQNQYQNF